MEFLVIGYAMEFSNPILLSEGLAYTCTSPLIGTSTILSESESIRATEGTTVLHLIDELQTIRFPEVCNEDWTFSKKMQFLLETKWMVFKSLIDK